jgi:hypothetical protein
VAKASTAARNAGANAIAALCNNAFLRIYAGTVPTTPNDALVAQTLLAECVLGATAFASAVAGVATANAISTDLSANDSGVASFFRVVASDNTTVIIQGTVGPLGSGADMEFPGSSTYIPVGARVSVPTLTFTVAE